MAEARELSERLVAEASRTPQPQLKKEVEIITREPSGRSPVGGLFSASAGGPGAGLTKKVSTPLFEARVPMSHMSLTLGKAMSSAASFRLSFTDSGQPHFARI